MSRQPLCLVIAGPSGVGKSTLINAALENNDRWRFSVSATTRPIRPGEEDGREYHFLDHEEFERRIAAGGFLEYAAVYGELYGMPVAEFERAAADGKHLLIEVDTVGCLSIRSLRPQLPLLAVLPPDLTELKRRLRDRGTEDEASLKRRFAQIIAELQRMRAFDYAIINDDLDTAVKQLLLLLELLEAGLHHVTPQVDRLLHSAGGTDEA